ncbi:cupredoxin domain-containing protein, partial [Bordetella bronchiseptica]
MLPAAWLAWAGGGGAPRAAPAADLPTFTLTFQPDGTFEPARL